MPLVRALVSAFDRPFELPYDTALVASAESDRVAGAFLAGYRAALRSLVPSLAPGHRAALCATEEGGARPSAIQTRLDPSGDGFTLSGRKLWVTGGTEADRLLVVATAGTDAEGLTRLKVANVDAHAAGVRIQPGDPAPFVPEVLHAEVTFEDVRLGADDLLPGDGYTRCLKPFRTLEDVHVHASVVAYAVSVGERAGWPERTLEDGLGLLASGRALAQMAADAPGTHLALSGALALAARWWTSVEPHWERVDSETKERWLRDRPLLGVAERVRKLRTESAWKALRAP